MTVQGILVGGISNLGGESTGWEIQLDDPLIVEGRTLTTIEVDLDLDRIAPYGNSHVEATGSLRVRSGIERQFCPVLEIESIRKV
jgi:hypothetical protein